MWAYLYGFLGWSLHVPCSRTKPGHRHCVCELHDLERASSEAAEAAAAVGDEYARQEWLGLTKVLTCWNGWTTRRKVPYQPPISADLDTGERDVYWTLLRRWTTEQRALVDELNAELEHAG